MIKTYIRLNYFLTLFILMGLMKTLDTRAQVTTHTFVYTGAVQYFTVPACVSNISVTAMGAQGGTNAVGTVVGGLGGSATGVIPVNMGDVLQIFVGGTNGFNGGGAAGMSSGTTPCALSNGGVGGGATDIRLNGAALANRVIVAGGGGGAGGDRIGGCGRGCGGGGGGGYYGGGGGAGWPGATVGGTLASGGSQTAGGTGGTSVYAVINNGFPGSLGLGGAGGGEVGSTTQGTPNQSALTGGVGGGLTGASGQHIGGSGWWPGQSGAGGSSYLGPTLTNTSTSSGVRSGNGIITFSYTFNGAGVLASATSNSICAGTSITLTASNVLSYTWIPSGSNSTTYTDTPATTTSYTVQGTNSFNCISQAVITVTVDPNVPNLTVANSASASSGICPFKTATLTASGATSYTWNGGTPVTNGVSFAPLTTSGYTVTGGNACGTSTAATSISIHPLPVVNPSASSPSLCSGLSLTLTSTGNYTNHTWAGGYTSGVGFFPTLTNTYVVTGTSALSCTNSAAVVVTVVTTPALAPTYPSLICFGQTAILTATGATNYTWLPVAGSASAAPSVTVSPAVTTTYTVIKANANCVDTKTFVLNVNALPGVFAIVTPTVICALKTATLFGGGALTFTWTTTSFTTNGNSPVVAPSVPTTYTVVGSDGICTNTTTVSLAVDPNPTLSASANPSVICSGQTTTLTALGGVNYTWSATTGTAYTANHTDNPTQPTLYTVTGDNSFGCTSSVNQIVLVNQLPPIAVVANKTLVCIGGDAKLTAAGANSYQWDPGAGSAITPTVNVNPMVTTSYTVEGTNSSTGCKNQKSITITVFEPSVAVSSPTSTCFGGNINIVASGATSYTWHLGNGVTHPFATVLVTPTVFTIYTVTALTSTTGGLSCPSTNTTSIDIFYNPTITALPQRPTICKFESVQLYGSGGVSYSWNDPQSQTGATITVSPQLQTTYTVIGTDLNGCVSTGTVIVKVSPCVGLNELNASNAGITIYPNPNSGNFTVQSSLPITLTLTNELGQIIKTYNIVDANTKIQVNDLAKGIYFISGQKDNLKVYEKIIVSQ